MRKHLKTLLVASTMVVSLGIAPAIYAHDAGGGDDSMMGQGGMMEQMSSMMENCNEMMQAMKGSEHGGHRPNEQRHDQSPQQQDQPRPEDNAG